MKHLILNLSPLNDRSDMTGVEYTVKKTLAFALVYIVGALLGEAVVIGSLYGMGYDPLNGIMPGGMAMELLMYFGFVCFAAVALLYNRWIQKQLLGFLGLNGKVLDHGFGAVLAILLIALTLGLGGLFGAVRFSRVNTDPDVTALFLYALAFVVQGAAEEILCRGFLLHSLKRKVSLRMAIFISSTVFVLLHIKNTTILDADMPYVVLGIVNLYLISFVFALLVEKRGNLWIACGLHSVWNFILHTVLGLTLSGNETVTTGLFQFDVDGDNVWTGAEYGLEAGLAVTLVLMVCVGVLLMFSRQKGKDKNSGIQQ